jgi:hypothetical protein
VRIISVESTDLFTGTVARPLQIVRVTISGEGTGPPGRAAELTVSVQGPGVATPFPAVAAAPEPGTEATVEVGVQISAPWQPGSVRRATVTAERGAAGPGGGARARAETQAEITAAEPGWTMWMVSHFHYDPVWWDTQGEFTESRLLLPDEHGNLPEVRTAFELVTLHLDAARRDPDYKFVLAEIDYLKPHFDAHPEDREDLRRFLRDGRIEIVGGSYNEPNTNLTCAESTIRNAIYGIGYQRDVLGADPRTAWMLDAFGFDPGYPGLMAAAGLTSSAWARGPFHQWGPQQTVGSNERMQFPSEFEWISPDGAGLLTSYMANHYGSGWATAQAPDLASAEQVAYEQFRQLAPVAATRNVLLPVGADHVIPSRWATGIHRDWNERYVWPRFVTALPSEFFGAVRADATGSRTWMTPQTRDMNPVYTGKDVTYTDTKQAQRAGEIAVTDAERLATLACVASASHQGAPPFGYPAETLDKAWRQLVFGAHHDAITGTESDQVYLDLLGGWREAWQRGHDARSGAADYLASLVDTQADPSAQTCVIVFNTLAVTRSALATVTLSLSAATAPWVTLTDEAGADVPCLAEGITRHADGSLATVTLTFRAADLPALGYRGYPVVPAAQTSPSPGWQPLGAAMIENQAFEVHADPGAGGTLARIFDKRLGAELLRPGGAGNELVVQDEHDYHPRWNEGQWLLSPKGPGRGLSARAAGVRAERCAIGSRLVAESADGDLRFTQETLLWDGVDRVEFRTHVDGSIGQDRLLRVRFPADVPGGLPVYQTATAVIGRPPGAADTDVAQHWFTLDSPAHEWFGLGSTARVAVGGGGLMRAIGVAEVVTPFVMNGFATTGDGDADVNTLEDERAAVRELVAALAAQGVTATCSRADGPRYGAIDLDSNLPDFRIALGDADRNGFTAEVLAGPSERTGAARIWVPATRTRDDVFAPGTDARGARDLPVLIVAGHGPGGLAAAIRELVRDLADSVVEAADGAGAAATDGPPLADRSVALFNRGTPSGLVTPEGTLNLSLMRSSSAWPGGVWIDGEKRTAPDGSSFNWQHWSHTFEYALAAGPGDWRTAGFNAAGEDYNRPPVTRQTGQHGGPLPVRASLGAVDPPEVTLTALKPRGNPLASGRPAAAGPGGVLVRLRETVGRPARATVRLRGGGQARVTDLLEEADGDLLPAEDGGTIVDMSPIGLASLAIDAPLTGPADGNTGAGSTGAGSTGPDEPGGAPAAGAEPAQPVYGRYWLHGKGPAPAGNLPVAVHVRPGRVTLAPGAAGALLVSVGCGPEPASGQVELDVPPGLEVEPAGPLGYDLPAGGHTSWDVAVRAGTGAAGGRYFVAARIRDGLGQVIEDAALVAVGEPGRFDTSLPLAELLPLIEADLAATTAEVVIDLLTPEVSCAPGQRAELAVRIGNRTASPLRGEAQLVSPFGSWEALGPWTAGFAAAPGADAIVRYPVVVPATARPGAQWWALVKVMYFGRVRYTSAAPVTVTAETVNG